MFIEKQQGADGFTIHRQDPGHIRFLQTRIDTICRRHDVLYQRSRLITRKKFGGSDVSHQVTFGMVTRRSIAFQTFASRKFKIWKKILSSFSNSENRPLGDNGCRGLYQETCWDPICELAFGS